MDDLVRRRNVFEQKTVGRFSFTLKARPTELLKSVNGLEKSVETGKKTPSFQVLSSFPI